ncbi:MAG: hypothetical protein V2J10_08045 [Wenzhouxiangella sp.]|jgi:hypothetical protein|nr:hypothetical protein [Wenzhouxiangella sp.]
MGRHRPPVLIQRELLLNAQREPDPDRIGELVDFQRRGHRILIVAEQPSRWQPTRRSVDHDLALQQKLHQLVRRAGSAFDAVVYLPTGFFSRKSARLEELDQLAARYDVTAADLVLIAQEGVLLESVVHSGGRALAVGEPPVAGATGHRSLKAALGSLN